MSSSITERLTQNGVARITGGCYLGFILASVLADQLGHIGLGEPQQIYQAGTRKRNAETKATTRARRNNVGGSTTAW